MQQRRHPAANGIQPESITITGRKNEDRNIGRTCGFKMRNPAGNMTNDPAAASESVGEDQRALRRQVNFICIGIGDADERVPVPAEQKTVFRAESFIACVHADLIQTVPDSARIVRKDDLDGLGRDAEDARHGGQVCRLPLAQFYALCTGQIGKLIALKQRAESVIGAQRSTAAGKILNHRVKDCCVRLHGIDRFWLFAARRVLDPSLDIDGREADPLGFDI